MLTSAEQYFLEEQALHETKYLAGVNPRQQSATLHREYIERLLAQFLAPAGRLLVCSYGSSRPEGTRADLLVDELIEWGLPVLRIDDVVSPEHRFVITRVVTVARRAD